MKVASRILEADPPILYLVSDGPRESVPGEEELCMEIRSMVESMPWKCPVKKIYSQENLGCGKRVSSGITEVLEMEESVIILEDDILPNLDFFRFCDELLSYYWNDESVFMISGLQRKEKVGASNGYKFDFNHLIWGWATWRRAWRHYVFDFATYLKEKEFVNSLAPIRNDNSLDNTYRLFNRLHYAFEKENLDTWDYQWSLCQIRHRAYSISPNWSLVQNLGFDSQATHTTHPDQHWGSRYNSYNFNFPITHPSPGLLASATKYYDAGDAELAMKYAQEGISKFPYEIRLYVLMAVITHSIGDLANARQVCEDALKIDPDNSMVNGLLRTVLKQS